MTKTATYMTAPRAMLAMGAVGAVIGGAVAAATNYGKVRQGAMTRDAAMKNVLRESGTTGLATATGTAVVGAMGVTGLLSLTGMVLVMAGVKHWADRVIDGKNATALAGKPSTKTTAAAKTTTKAKAAAKSAAKTETDGTPAA